MKRFLKTLRLIAPLALVPAALAAGPLPDSSTRYISSSCARYCRDVCNANGEPCCILDYNTCGCC
jgi:hypothetical protein